jgi:hypothetical protein
MLKNHSHRRKIQIKEKYELSLFPQENLLGIPNRKGFDLEIYSDKRYCLITFRDFNCFYVKDKKRIDSSFCRAHIAFLENSLGTE